MSNYFQRYRQNPLSNFTLQRKIVGGKISLIPVNVKGKKALKMKESHARSYKTHCKPDYMYIGNHTPKVPMVESYTPEVPSTQTPKASKSQILKEIRSLF